MIGALLLDHGNLVAIGDRRPASVAALHLQISFATPSLPEDVRAIGAGTGAGSAVVVDTWFQHDQGKRTETLEHAKPCVMCSGGVRRPFLM